MEKVKTPLPVGRSHFEKVIEGGFYYVDKTLFIKDIIDNSAEVTLCTRPRRFGKTLNQTMLKCFFEDTSPFGGKDTRTLFNGLKIESAGDKYMNHQGKYPVIFLSFKEGRMGNFEESRFKLKYRIASEFRRHRYVLEKFADNGRKNLYEKFCSFEDTSDDYTQTLQYLCECLEMYYGKKVIILIDEYDVPLENAWVRGFYDEMIKFIRPLLSDALKDNPYLEFAVITGCLRISKESIFTGMNNLKVISILSDNYSEYFGFTQPEIDDLLNHYGLTEKRQILEDWYNGYLFGSATVYNPWSAVQMVDDWRVKINKHPEPYWANTSSNDIIHKLIIRADDEMKTELETLIAGGTISKVIHEDITYDEIEKDAQNLWNFLFFTGYLKKVSQTVDDFNRIVVEMKIPNAELAIVFVNKIQEWFKDSIKSKDLTTFFNAIFNADVETFQSELSALLRESISFMDSAENFYHGFMTGILSRIDGFLLKSNREAGDGRSDIVMYAVGDGKAVIFELKTAKKFHDLPAVCAEALKQIEDNNYVDYWYEEGYDDIIKYGIGFYKKRCKVVKQV